MTQASLPARPEARISPIVGLAALVIGVFVAFLLGIILGVRGTDVAIMSMSLATAFLGIMPLLIDQSRPPEDRHVLITLMALSYVAFFAAPAFTQYLVSPPITGRFFALPNIEPYDILAGQLAAFVGLVSLLIGYAAPIGRLLSRALPKPSVEWPPQVAIGVAMVTLPLGWMIYLGGQFNLIPARAGSGVLGAIASSVFYGIALLALVYFRYRSRNALLMMLLVIPPTMAFNFFTGSKRLFLSPLLMVVLAYVVQTRKIRAWWFAVLVGALVLLYPIAQFYREVVQQGYTLRATEVLQNPGRAISAISGFASSFDAGTYIGTGIQQATSRLDALGITCVIVRDTPERVPYQRGWSIGYIFISYIPRVLWPGKPVTTIGQWVTDHYGSGPIIESRTGPSWVGEFYFNFGYAGVICGLALFGIFFRFIAEVCFGRDATIPAMLAGVVVLDAAARSPQGGLITVVNGVVFKTAPIILTHLALRMFLSRSRPEGGAEPPT